MNKTIIFVNIGIGQFRGGGEMFDLNIGDEFHKLGYKIKFYYLRPILGEDKFDFPSYVKKCPIRSIWLYPWTSFLHKVPIINKIGIIRGIPRMLGQLLFEFMCFNKIKKTEKDFFFLQTCGMPWLSSLVYNKLNKKAITWWPGPIENSIDHYFSKRNWQMIANGDAIKRIRRRGFKNIENINLGVNEIFLNKTKKSKKQIKKDLGISENEKVLVFVGRLIPIKNLFFLIDVFKLVHKNVPHTKLLIIGEGFLKEKLIAYAKDKGMQDHIIFVNFQKHEVLKKYYDASDIFLLTSTYDNFPNVLVEAGASGLPVVASDVGGVSEIIVNGYNGYCIGLDKKNFSNKIISLLKSESKLKTYGENAYDFVKKEYSWHNSTAKYLKFIKGAN